MKHFTLVRRFMGQYTTSFDRCDAERESEDASQNDCQIVCGFDGHIDRPTCARDTDCSP
jgi:hypothetical protein